jgi:hypothetical protein
MNININNDNFGLKDVIKYYEKQGYIFYNLFKFKTLKDYLDFEKIKRKNKDKLIIYYNFSSIYSKNATKFYKKIIKIFLKYIYKKYISFNEYNFTKNTIIFLHKYKYLLTNKKCIQNKNKLLDIQNILLTKYYKCDICFNEESNSIYKCFQCNFQSCDTCYKKLKKINDKCCCCKCKY